PTSPFFPYTTLFRSLLSSLHDRPPVFILLCTYCVIEIELYMILLNKLHAGRRPVNLLMIDNYDSFTYNLVHYIEGNPYKAGIKVVTLDQLSDDLIEEFNIIGIIISTGP